MHISLQRRETLAVIAEHQAVESSVNIPLPVKGCGGSQMQILRAEDVEVIMIQGPGRE